MCWLGCSDLISGVGKRLVVLLIPVEFLSERVVVKRVGYCMCESDVSERFSFGFAWRAFRLVTCCYLHRNHHHVFGSGCPVHVRRLTSAELILLDSTRQHMDPGIHWYYSSTCCHRRGFPNSSIYSILTQYVNPISNRHEAMCSRQCRSTRAPDSIPEVVLLAVQVGW